MHQSLISLLYRASVLLLNFRTCFYKGGKLDFSISAMFKFRRICSRFVLVFLASICMSSSVNFSAARFLSRSSFSFFHFSLAKLSPAFRFPTLQTSFFVLPPSHYSFEISNPTIPHYRPFYVFSMVANSRIS